jgi:CheY-like chemotaxis protein
MIQDAMSRPDGQEWQGAHRDIGQIESAVRRAAALVHQLLAFARREVVQPKALDLNELVVGTEQLLGRTLGQHIDLTTSLMPELGIVVADHGQIEQVLINLAINARDAMPQGGVLTITTSELVVARSLTGMRATVPPGRYARLQIIDTGTGMPRHVLRRVFEPFFTTKPKGEGSGLGLATVYGIVAQARGHVEIASEPGLGTTCTVLLPITEHCSDPEEEHGATPSRGGGRTVLVVEDEAPLRDVTERLLSRNGYHVLAARDGEHAIDLAAQHPAAIDVLLTDLIMPKVLGREVAQRVAELRPNIAVLYMSGFPEPILSAEGNLEPGAALLEKPFSESALIEKLLEVAPTDDWVADAR